MFRRVPVRLALLAATAGSFALVACSDDNSPTAIPDYDQFTVSSAGVGDVTTPGAELGLIKICGPVGNSATFTLSVVAGSTVGVTTTTLLTPVTVNAGVCEVVATGTGPGWENVAITQTSPGFLSASAERNGNGTITTESFSNGASVILNNNHGWAITFTNQVLAAQGCSPGYWKNHTGAGAWPAPYTPGQAFSSVFDNAFPGKTLLQVLGQGGGGLNALGRQTVSALLNAQRLGAANYGMSASAVIAAFNGAYPGTDYTTLKDLFEGMTDINGRVCPLN